MSSPSRYCFFLCNLEEDNLFLAQQSAHSGMAVGQALEEAEYFCKSV